MFCWLNSMVSLNFGDVSHDFVFVHAYAAVMGRGAAFLRVFVNVV